MAGPEEVAACANIQELAATLDRESVSWIDDRLFSLRADEIEALTMNVEDHSLELVREESGFWVRGQKPRHVDIETGNDVLQTLVSIHGTLAAAEVNPTTIDFGPRDFVQLRSAVVGPSDRYQERVLIGKVLPNGERWAKRVSDSAVLRIDSVAASSLELDADVLKNRSLIDVATSAVQSVELLAHGRTMRWVIDNSGVLQPDPVTALPFDSKRIESMRSQLAKLRAKKWLIRPRDWANIKSLWQVNFDVVDQDNALRRYLLHIAMNPNQHTVAWLGDSTDYFEPEPELKDLLALIVR